jgi:16S rRNA (uracil1498-N3)-methyltransferase
VVKHRFFVPREQFTDGIVRIVGENARQIRTVLRLRPSDEIGVLDGAGNEYHCVLEAMRKDEVVARIHHVMSVDTEPDVHITVVQSLAKGEKVEQVIQHGTEIGVSRFLIVRTDRSVVRLDGERERGRVQRWQRIAKEAAEQARRAKIPEVNGVVSLGEALQGLEGTKTALLHPAHTSVSLVEWMESDDTINGVAVIVGPEGGFTEREVALCEQFGASAVSLMPRILRTETAALVAVSQILLMVGVRGTRQGTSL